MADGRAQKKLRDATARRVKWFQDHPRLKTAHYLSSLLTFGLVLILASISLSREARTRRRFPRSTWFYRVRSRIAAERRDEAWMKDTITIAENPGSGFAANL